PLHATFIYMVVPPADIGECHFHAEVGFDELGDLSKTVAKAPARVDGARSGIVFFGIGRTQHLDRFKGLVTGSMQDAIHGLLIHRFKSVAGRRSARSSSSYSKGADIAH